MSYLAKSVLFTSFQRYICVRNIFLRMASRRDIHAWKCFCSCELPCRCAECVLLQCTFLSSA